MVGKAGLEQVDAKWFPPPFSPHPAGQMQTGRSPADLSPSGSAYLGEEAGQKPLKGKGDRGLPSWGVEFKSPGRVLA